MSTPGDIIGKTIEFVWKPQCTEHPRCTHDISHTHHGILPLYSGKESGHFS